MIDMTRLLNGDADNGLVEAPDWLRGQAVCPAIIKGELFWRYQGVTMAGPPPQGVTYSHIDVHMLPDDYGPEGEPIQVTPRIVDVNGAVSCTDVHGDQRAMIDKRAYDLVVETAGRSTALWFFYPEVEDGNPQPLACFIPVRQAPVPSSLDGLLASMERSDGFEYEYKFMLFALIEPSTINIRHYLGEKHLAQLPRFGGLAIPEEDMHE